MEVVVGFLVVGMVIGIAAFFVTREATRIARRPPPALFHLDDASSAESVRDTTYFLMAFIWSA